MSVKAAKVYAGVKKGFKWADRALERMGVHNANQRIQDYLTDQLGNAASAVGRTLAWAAPAFVGTVGTLLMGRGGAMYDHPIGPPNIGENIMGINFNGHY